MVEEWRENMVGKNGERGWNVDRKMWVSTCGIRTFSKQIYLSLDV
jgi:hypothetical protein